jgi:uncharacterized protein
MLNPPDAKSPADDASTFGSRQVLRRVLHAVRYTRPSVEAMTRRAMVMYFLRCLVCFETLRDWFGNTGNPALQEALIERPSLIACVRRPYMNGAWSVERKMGAIREHYHLLSQDLGFLRFGADASINLARIDDHIQLRIDKAAWFEHEGELTLSLFDGPLRLYSLVFALGESQGHRFGYIGALQGLGSNDALDIYRALTHRLHGLRPRDLLIAAFRKLCLRLGVTRILAITDDASVSRSAYFREKVKVYANYDQIWAENGGRVVDGGFFELSPAVAQRAMADIPSRKRAMYRRRYELLDDLGRQIDASVQQAARRCAPSSSAEAPQRAATSPRSGDGPTRAPRVNTRLPDMS